MSATLLPCPFCGGEASDTGELKYSPSHVKEQGWDQSRFYFCNCIRCGVSNAGVVGHATKSNAVAAWNRRSPLGAAS